MGLVAALPAGCGRTARAVPAGCGRPVPPRSRSGTDRGIRAARQGNRVIMAPTTHCYFDYYQTDDTAREPLAWGGYLPLGQVYAFDPAEGLSSDERQFLLGVQANLWTEYIPDFDQAQYMLLPRLGALAEVGWGTATDDYEGFVRRMRRLTGLYDACGYR